MFQKVLVIIIMRFVKNNVLWPKYIDIYQFWGSTLHFFFIIHKNGKSAITWPILKLNSTSFWLLKKNPRMNNKNFRKRGPQRVPLLFLYEVSIVVLIDFIAILLTPHIFLTQINTNMYLIHFHSKNIKMSFPRSWVFKVSNPLQTFIIHPIVVK